jgi:GntR family transcriptional repressor for pyruvate dehydrogenase complex
MVIKPVERITVADAIIEQLVALIDSGQFRPGERMPSEQELTERFAVGRTSVREALKALQVLGLVERRTEGTFVSSELSSGVLGRYLATGMLAQRIDVLHLFDARRLVEGEICARAAANVTPATLADLEALCAAMEAVPEEDFTTFFDLDMRFHLRICDLNENPVLVRMWNVIHDLLESYRGRIAAIPTIKEQTNMNHQDLLAALAAQDGDAARLTVHRSLDRIERLFVAALAKGNGRG